MKAKRSSGLLPIRRCTMIFVGPASSPTIPTLSRVRFAGSIVVSRSCCIVISPSPLKRVGELLVAVEFFAPGARNVQNFSAQRQDGLNAAVARLLGGTAGRIAFHDEELSVLARGGAAIGKLAGETKFSRR